MNELGLTFFLVGAAILVLPFCDRKNNSVRSVLFGVCIALTWRYVWWRFAETLPPLALTFDSLFAWGFSAVEALAVVGWTASFVTLSRTKDRSREATEQSAWISVGSPAPISPFDWAVDNSWARKPNGITSGRVEGLGDLRRPCRLRNRQAKCRDHRWVGDLTQPLRREGGKR